MFEEMNFCFLLDTDDEPETGNTEVFGRSYYIFNYFQLCIVKTFLQKMCCVWDYSASNH
jgi:hypothetical protein